MNALTSFVLVAFMSAFVNASGLRLITMSDQASDTDSKDGRELLSPWCDPATPVEWHP